MNKSEYNIYLQSIAWFKKSSAVRRRARGTCERCGKNKVAHVHHLTYERVGDEELGDLQAVCATCHKFLHDKSKVDPADSSYKSIADLAEEIRELARKRARERSYV